MRDRAYIREVQSSPAFPETFERVLDPRDSRRIVAAICRNFAAVDDEGDPTEDAVADVILDPFDLALLRLDCRVASPPRPP